MPDKSARRHIAFFLPALNMGGAERVDVTLANTLARQGHQIDMLVIKREGPFLDELSHDVNLIELGGKGSLRAVPYLVAYMRRHRPEWLVAALPGPNLAAITARLIRRVWPGMAASRAAITQHIAFTQHAASETKLHSKLRHYIARYAYRWTDCRIAVSQAVANDLAVNIGVAHESIAVIPNPFDVETIAENGRLRPDHPWLGDDFHSPVLVSAGRMEDQKDFTTLLNAVAGLDHVHLIILGEGPNHAHLQELADRLGIADRVDFAGFAGNPYGYMHYADAFVLASHYEGFGNVIVEALIQGTPVIASNCPHGPAEILDDGMYGRLVPPGDAATLQKAIATSLDEDRDNEAAHAQRIKRGQSYDSAIIAQRYLEALYS